MQMVKGNEMPKRDLDAYVKERLPEPPKVPPRKKKREPKRGGKKR